MRNIVFDRSRAFHFYATFYVSIRDVGFVCNSLYYLTNRRHSVFTLVLRMYSWTPHQAFISVSFSLRLAMQVIFSSSLPSYGACGACTQRLKGHNGKMERVEGKEGWKEGRRPSKPTCHKKLFALQYTPEADALQRAHFLTLAAGLERKKKHNRSWRRPPR